MSIKNCVLKDIVIKIIMVVIVSLLFVSCDKEWHEYSYRSQRIKVVDKETFISCYKITSNTEHVRGGILVHDTLFIDLPLMLVENKSNIQPWNVNTTFELKSLRSSSHLKRPYTLCKEKNTDTIEVFVDGYLLKYLLMIEE